jgi:hypothetical protein
MENCGYLKSLDGERMLSNKQERSDRHNVNVHLQSVRVSILSPQALTGYCNLGIQVSLPSAQRETLFQQSFVTNAGLAV